MDTQNSSKLTHLDSMTSLKTRQLSNMVNDLKVSVKPQYARELRKAKQLKETLSILKEAEKQRIEDITSKVNKVEELKNDLKTRNERLRTSLNMLTKEANLDLKKECAGKVQMKEEDSLVGKRIKAKKDELQDKYDELGRTSKRDYESRLTDLIGTYTEITEKIIEERSQREKDYEGLILELGKDVLKINDSLIDMKKNRERLHDKLSGLVSEFRTDIQEELKQEYKEREKNEIVLIKVLENIMNRFEEEDEEYYD